MSANTLKLITYALALCAFVAAAFTQGAIHGGVLFPRPGDVRLEGVHPDDLR
jgi:hypothetical protein